MKGRLLLTILLLFVAGLTVPAQQNKTKRKPATTQQARKTSSAQTRKKTTTQARKKTTTQARKKTTTQARKKTVIQPSRTANTRQTNRATSAPKNQPTVKGLQNERKKLQEQRAANQRKQEELKQGVKKGMENLMALDQEIAEKRKEVDTIRNDITRLDTHIALLNRQLDVLSQELEERQQRYMKSIRYQHRNRSVQNQMMFVFSADNFNQMYRRMRFAREYAAYQKAQGEAVKSKQEQVTKKKLELAESKVKKDDLLAKGEREKKNLEGRQNAQQQQVAQLKKQQKTVEALIVEQQRKEEELNARIDKLIAEEIAREKARQEAEARRKAEAEAARKRAEEQARQKELAKKEKGKSGYHVAEPKPSEVRKTASKPTTAGHSTAEAYAMPAADRQLSGSFEANRGRLPLPITGSYRLVRGFGPYSPEGLSKVTLQSNGWHLKGQGGAKVQSVFDGEVSGVYYQGGSYIVTVRHGKYISAYINLASVSVRKGQRVKTRDVLGGLGADLTMQFQLRNWNQLLNPSGWIAR